MNQEFNANAGKYLETINKEVTSPEIIHIIFNSYNSYRVFI
jgi:hypothetical protein